MDVVVGLLLGFMVGFSAGFYGYRPLVRNREFVRRVATYVAAIQARVLTPDPLEASRPLGTRNAEHNRKARELREARKRASGVEN